MQENHILQSNYNLLRIIFSKMQSRQISCSCPCSNSFFFFSNYSCFTNMGWVKFVCLGKIENITFVSWIKLRFMFSNIYLISVHRLQESEMMTIKAIFKLPFYFYLIKWFYHCNMLFWSCYLFYHALFICHTELRS